MNKKMCEIEIRRTKKYEFLDFLGELFRNFVPVLFCRTLQHNLHINLLPPKPNFLARDVCVIF
jgi:hypothetical protein